MDARSSRYHDVYARWQRDPEGFWAEAANEIDWFEKPKTTFDRNAGIYGHWFLGRVSNTCSLSQFPPRLFLISWRRGQGFDLSRKLAATKLTLRI